MKIYCYMIHYSWGSLLGQIIKFRLLSILGVHVLWLPDTEFRFPHAPIKGNSLNTGDMSTTNHW